MGVPASTTPTPFALSSHDVRSPDANPTVGGPYMRGADPATAYTADGNRTRWNSLPSAIKAGAFSPSGNPLTNVSSGDQAAVTYSQITEDHVE